MVAHLPALAAESARETALLMAEALPAKAGAAARLLRATPGIPLLMIIYPYIAQIRSAPSSFATTQPYTLHPTPISNFLKLV